MLRSIKMSFQLEIPTTTWSSSIPRTEVVPNDTDNKCSNRWCHANYANRPPPEKKTVTACTLQDVTYGYDTGIIAMLPHSKSS